MDENKLKELKRVGYEIHKCCGLCENFACLGLSDFGTCKVITYQHLKHSDAKRQLSVNRYGSCKDGFKLSQDGMRILGVWDQFI